MFGFELSRNHLGAPLEEIIYVIEGVRSDHVDYVVIQVRVVLYCPPLTMCLKMSR